MQKIVLIPGNHNSLVTEIWFPSTVKALTDLGCEVVTENMPDPITAKESIWLPFIESELKVDADTIAIGHSSGAIALLRYAETHKVKGLVLVGAYHTDGGDEIEQASGYFNRPWNWQAIDQNVDFIIQFASTDDPYIPIEEARFLKTQIPKIEYIEFNDKGHMGEDANLFDFPELVSAIKEKL